MATDSFPRDPSTNSTIPAEYHLAITFYKSLLLTEKGIPSLKEFIEAIGVNPGNWQTKQMCFTTFDPKEIYSTVNIPTSERSLS
jgi:hypothetical protein